MCLVTQNEIKVLIWVICLSFTLCSFSQEKKKATLYFNKEPLVSALSILEETFEVRFSFPDHLLEKEYITLSFKEKELQFLLSEITSQTSLIFQVINERYIIITEDTLSLNKIQALENVIISGYLTEGIAKKKNAVFLIKPNKIGLLPGLIEADVLESLQQLPSVISPNETASGFTVRGGGFDQNRMIWNGINIYHKGHLFGMISAFNSNSSNQVLFINKGTHPKYGERISSVIDIFSKYSIPHKVEGDISINGISANGYINVPILKDKLNVQASIRRSYTEWYESFTFKEYAKKVFQTTKIEHAKDLYDDFNFIDYNININFHPTKNHKINLGTIYIDNQLDFIVKDTDKEASFNDVLSIKDEGYGFNWKWNLRDKYLVKTNAFVSKYRFNYNFIESNTEGQISDFDKRNIIFDSGFSSEVEFKKSQEQLYSLGYQYSFKDVSYAYLKTEELAFVLDTDQRIASTHSLFGNFSYQNNPDLSLNIGFRVNYYNQLEEVKIEPRIVFYKHIFNNIGLQLSGEIKNQILSEIDETIISDLSLENKLWRLVDGTNFPILNSKQVSGGFIYSTNGWIMDVDCFYKKIRGVSALSLGFLNPEDSGFHIGEQNVIGVDFYLKKNINNLLVWLSYSFNDVKSKFEGINNEEYFPSNTNINHVFFTSFTYKIKSFRLALSWNWRTGKPFTESITEPTTNEISFQEINSKRLPDYQRMDISSTYQFNLSEQRGINGKIGFSIRNIFNQKNHISREYLGNNSLADPIEVVDKTSLGFTPNFLFNLTW